MAEFEVCVLNADNEIKQTIVFGKKRPDVFSGELKFSDQHIHLDDSIQTIKNKIVIELGVNAVSYAELHMFSYFNRDSMSDNKLLEIYNELTSNEEIPLTVVKLRHFLSNYWVSEPIDLTKELYTYEDLRAIHNNQPIKKILGRKFNKNVNHLFSTNPFQCITPYIKTDAPLYSTDNSVLLNMGILKEHKIYVCLASDVFEYASTQDIDQEYISSSYYPFLFVKDILNLSDLTGRSQELIVESKKAITEDVVRLYEIVDAFYKIKGDNDFLLYESEGIVNFNIGIKTDFVDLLPLDSIFKNIHATANVPFIKYNPGIRRENMYRLYSKELYTNGRRKPYLDAPVILKLSKEIGKSGEIALHTNVTFKSMNVKLYVDFQKDGSLRVHANLIEPITKVELNELLISGLNPVIMDINAFIKPIGYNIQTFGSLNDSHIEIYNMRYISSITIKKPSDFILNTYRNCLSSIFVVETSDVNSADGAKLRYKRVDNFQDMDPIDEFISIENNKHTEIDDIIRMLAKEFGMDEETARNKVVAFYSKFAVVDNRTNNNAGFPVTLQISRADKKLYISIDNITSVEYIDIVKTYLDGIIRIYHSPKTTGIPVKDIQSICKREINFDAIEKTMAEAVVIEPPPPPVELDKDFFENTVAAAVATTKEYNDDDDDLFNVDFEGGANDDDEINPDGMKLKNPNPFQKRIEDRDPELIKFSNDGKTNQFSRTCRGEVNRQPIILNETEKDRIDQATKAKGKFTNWKELLKHASENAPDDIKSYINTLWLDKKTPMDQKQFEVFAKKLIESDTESDLGKKSEKDYIKKLSGLIKNKKPVTEMNMVLSELVLKIKEPYPTQNELEEFVSNEMKAKRDAIIAKIWGYIEPMIGSYMGAISHSSDPSKKFWYICPRYWSLKSNTSLTDGEVKELIENEGAKILIPYKSETVPKGAYIYEFAHPQEHFVEGKYIPHYPGFIKNSKSKFDFPCCFKRDQVIESTVSEDDNKEPAQEVEQDLSYIAETNKYPIPKKRWGFLPKPVQDFFNIDNHDCVSKIDENTIEREHPCLLRYGVEQSVDQSIIGCFADIYANIHDDMPVPSIAEMREIIIDAITLEVFLSYNNNALSVIFKPDTYEDSDLSKYANSTFYKSIDETNELEVNFRKEVIGAYENFQRYIRDPDAHIDHTYLWDIMTKPNEKLFPLSKPDPDEVNIEGLNLGLNLVILEVTRDSDSIELICPTNMYSDYIYDIRFQRTAILIKQGDFYEPVYLYEDIGGTIKRKIWFHIDGDYKGIDMREILQRIQKIIANQCRPKNSLKIEKYEYNKALNANGKYEYRPALNASKTLAILRDNANYIIRDQIVNYHFKTIGFRVGIEEQSVFVPCFPSNFISLLTLTFIDDADNWNDYETTIRLLTIVYEKTQKLVDCIPSRKVIDRDLVVGLLTKTNQYIKIQPPISKDASIEIDKNIGLGYKLIDIKSSDYITADIITTTNQPQDIDRISTISKIRKESNYYTLFRSTIRTLFGLYENRKRKFALIALVKNKDLTYNQKLNDITQLIIDLTQNDIEFVDNPNNERTKIECLARQCKVELPLYNSMTEKRNDAIYFGKISDELIRFKRVRSFILEPKNYLNISNVGYKINPDEILLLDSSINSAYLNESNVFSVKDYMKNITYDIAEPDKSKYTQPYANVEKL